MKQSPAMRKLAYERAVAHGERIVMVNGQRYAAYTMTKEELQVLFEENSFNTGGVSWLNMICRWRILGEFVPKDAVVKDEGRSDWWVGFVSSLSDSDRFNLNGFAGLNEVGKVLA